jgi:hypothetical protein
MNDEYYDEYDAFYCRDLIPLSNKLLELATDGNRYHAMLAIRLAAAQAARWLIKPVTGFVDAAHQAFFATSYRMNLNRGLVFVTGGNSGFINGSVYAQLDDDPELDVVPDALQPVCGWSLGSHDRSREVFEKWHLSGTSLRAAWQVQNVVRKMAAGDRMYQYLLQQQPDGDPSLVDTSIIAARYPGWRRDDGSAPTLDVGSLV